MCVPVGTHGRAVHILRIAGVLKLWSQGGQILLLAVDDLAFQRQRKLPDGRHGHDLRRNQREPGRLDLVHIPAALAPAHADDFFVVRTHRHVDGKFRILVQLLPGKAVFDSTRTAIIEMSGAAGITLIPDTERNPLYTTTYGVGEVIRDAITKGCRHFIVGIGGSATNDGGAGMLQALGFGLLDKNGNPVPFGAMGLEVLDKITTDNVLPELKDCTFRIACDVTNTLCGEQGCSAIFGPQKGATPAMILQMDKWLAYYATLAREIFPHANPKAAGSGAAGGLGFAFMTFLNGTLESGIKIVLEETRLSDYIKDADIVVTGEGRLDGQTVMGKAPIGVAKIAKQYDKPVLAFSGCVTKDATACNREGIDAFFPIVRGVIDLDTAMEKGHALHNMEAAAVQAARLIRAVKTQKC